MTVSAVSPGTSSFGRLRRRRRVALLVLCAVLGVALWAENDSLRHAAPGAAAAPSASIATPVRSGAHPDPAPGFSMEPLGAFADVLERPLFTESRRPAAPASPAVASSSFVLIGIVASSEAREALLERGQPPKLVRVVEGQDIEGWRVEAIRPDHVLIRRAGIPEELKLKDRPPKPLPTAKPPDRKPGG